MKADRLRRLTIGGRPYRWNARIGHWQGPTDCHRCIRVRIWGPAGKTGRALQADLLSTAAAGPWGACATDGSYPVPAHLRALIEHARTRGWDPDARGGTFRLTEAGAAGLELDGFRVTDRD